MLFSTMFQPVMILNSLQFICLIMTHIIYRKCILHAQKAVGCFTGGFVLRPFFSSNLSKLIHTMVSAVCLCLYLIEMYFIWTYCNSCFCFVFTGRRFSPWKIKSKWRGTGWFHSCTTDRWTYWGKNQNNIHYCFWFCSFYFTDQWLWSWMFQVPGVGPATAKLLRENGISTTYGLIGKYLSLKEEGVEPVEHADRFYFWLKSISKWFLKDALGDFCWECFVC